MRRRWILGLVTLVLALHPAVTRAQPARPAIYVAMGDSLARGIGATHPDQLGYVPRLFNFFRGNAQAGVDTLRNVGVPGETSTTLISGSQLANALAAINDPTTDVRVLTLDIGGNDLVALLGQEPCRTDPTGLLCRQAVASALLTFTLNYTSILTQLTTALAADPGDETIMVMTYFNYFSGTGNPLEQVIDGVLLGPDLTVGCAAPQATWGLNDVITCVGVQYAVTVADVYSPFIGKGATLTHIPDNDFHPNNAGYAHIASVFRRASRP